MDLLHGPGKKSFSSYADKDKALSDSEQLAIAEKFGYNSIAAQTIRARMEETRVMQKQAKLNAQASAHTKSHAQKVKEAQEALDAMGSITYEEMINTPVEEFDQLIQSKKAQKAQSDFETNQKQFYLDNPAELMKLSATERISLSRQLELG